MKGSGCAIRVHQTINTRLLTIGETTTLPKKTTRETTRLKRPSLLFILSQAMLVNPHARSFCAKNNLGSTLIREANVPKIDSNQ